MPSPASKFQLLTLLQLSQQVIKSYSPNLMVHPILQSSDTIPSFLSSPPAPRQLAEPIISLLPRLHVLVTGPGLGRDPTTQKVVAEVLKEARTRGIPFVLDADALLLVQEQPDLVRGYADCILTPNVVEFTRLARAVGVDVQLPMGEGEGEGENVASASDACERLSSALGGVTVIQKGRHDVISNGSVTLISDVEGGLKRSGGQGDTLTGVLGTFLAWRKAYHEGLWDTGEDGEKVAQAKCDIESEINDKGSGDSKKMSPTTTVLLAAWAGSTITRGCSRRAFAAKGRSMQASDLTDEVYGSFLELIGEPGVAKL